jgi:hypothetical protein
VPPPTCGTNNIWSPGSQTNTQWLMVDFGQNMLLTSIATQGNPGASQ